MSDSEDEWTDDEMEVTALDSIDPYITFAEAIIRTQVTCVEHFSYMPSKSAASGQS